MGFTYAGLKRLERRIKAVGLDMYLQGRKFHTFEHVAKDAEGYEIAEVIVKLGYWRKHANLHGYIVQTFAEGKDECQEVSLSLDNLKQLLEVVKYPTQMPKTDGFFFGASDNDEAQIKEDTEIIAKAIAFLTAPAITNEKGIWRDVYYRASW